MVTHTDVHFPEAGGLRQSIDRVTRKDENVYLDALGLAEQLFGDHMASNMIVLGAAYQAGAIAVSAEAIEEAIALNGVVGGHEHAGLPRRAPGRHRSRRPRARSARRASARCRWRRRSSSEARALVDFVGARGELRRLLEIRVPELIEYQDAGYARAYVEFVARALAAEPAGRTAFSEAVARHLFKLMAYKDEYEVARLHLKAGLAAQLAAEYPDGREGPVSPSSADPPGARVEEQDQVRHLVRRRLPAPHPHEGPAGLGPRPLRPGGGAPRGARADRRIPGADRQGHGRALARELRAGGEAGHPARHDSRLRGRQAGERPALPRRGARRVALGHVRVIGRSRRGGRRAWRIAGSTSGCSSRRSAARRR